jgi:secondary thiamine-phosphate synthase enzyme
VLDYIEEFMSKLIVEAERGAPLRAQHSQIWVESVGRPQFIDLTGEVAALVERSGIRDGLVNVQTRHTTTAIIVNENEPLLLDDLAKMLERLAPRDGQYQHNDFKRRIDVPPNEPANGHAHCQAIFLPTSVNLNIVDGRLQLGRWQSIFFVELDQGRERCVSLMVIGQTGE